MPLDPTTLEAAVGGRGPTADYEFEPEPGVILEPAAAPLRRGPAVRRPARRRRVRARRPPAGHEVGHRQRRGAHHQADPGDEPGPPGRHHHRDHGDRRRRRGPARRARAASADILVDRIGGVRDFFPNALTGAQRHDRDRAHRRASGQELKDGRVVAIAGPVVDVEFPPDALPEINTCVSHDHHDRGRRHRGARPRSPSRSATAGSRVICLRPTDGLCGAPRCATPATASPCRSATRCSATSSTCGASPSTSRASSR